VSSHEHGRYVRMIALLRVKMDFALSDYDIKCSSNNLKHVWGRVAGVNTVTENGQLTDGLNPGLPTDRVACVQKRAAVSGGTGRGDTQPRIIRSPPPNRRAHPHFHCLHRRQRPGMMTRGQ